MSSSAAQPLFSERRRFLRFPARVRVAYDLEGRWAISGTQDLSQGGMALASGLGVGLQSGAQATFLLHLPDGDRPQPAVGDILGVFHDVTRVRFASGQRELVERVRRYAEVIIVPTLESSLSDAVRDRTRLVALAGLYHELGRDTQALDLYHAALDLGATNREFLEAVAPAMLQQVRPFGARGATLLAQLRSAVAMSLAESPSPTLEAVARSLDTSQVIATGPEGVEVVPALPEHEIAALRESIRSNREALYKGFLQLLEERNRLRRLEQSVPANGAPAEQDVVPLLASIRSQLESLNDKPTPSAVPPSTTTPPPVVVAGPPPRAPIVAAPSADPPPAEPPARRRRSTVAGLVVGVLLLAGIGAALWVTRLSPTDVETARRAALARPASTAPRGTAVEAKAAAVPEPVAQAPGAAPTDPAGQAPSAVTASAPAAQAPSTTGAPAAQAPGAVTTGGPATQAPSAAPAPAAARVARTERATRSTAAASRSNAHVELALRHLKERKLTLAVQEARAGLASEPDNATAYRVLGIAYSMLGQESQSVAAFERFLELAPNDPAAERVRAVVRKHKGVSPPR